MKRKFKQLLSCMLVVLMLLSGIPMSEALAAKVVLSGTCGAEGDNLTWTLDSEGTLTVSGEGDMADYYMSISVDKNGTVNGMGQPREYAPWHSVRNKIEKIVIENSVTSIGDWAFYQCVQASSVYISSSVKSIGSAAFNECHRLKSVNIPQGVTNIRALTFEYCFSLENVSIPNSVVRIDIGAFDTCLSLREITIPKSVKTIAVQAFADCHSLKKVRIENPEIRLLSEAAMGNQTFFFPCLGFKSINIVAPFEDYIKKCIDNSDPYISGMVEILDTPAPIDGVVFYGYNNPNVQQYAGAHGFEFVGTEKPHQHSYTASVTKEATCTEAGVMTYTCECGDSYTESISAKGHTPSKAVKENEIPATCKNEGAYDEVIYCSVCAAEISREKKTVAKPEHNYISEAVAPTCDKDGYTVHTCSVCGDSYKGEVIKATGHIDNNNDRYCDNCKKNLTENPSENCSCNCHKNGFMGFIYKIMRFFWRLFKTNQYCACGVKHY